MDDDAFNEWVAKEAQGLFAAEAIRDPAFRSFLASMLEFTTHDANKVFLCQALAAAEKLGLSMSYAELERSLYKRVP